MNRARTSFLELRLFFSSFTQQTFSLLLWPLLTTSSKVLCEDLMGIGEYEEISFSCSRLVCYLLRYSVADFDCIAETNIIDLHQAPARCFQKHALKTGLLFCFFRYFEWPLADSPKVPAPTVQLLVNSPTNFWPTLMENNLLRLEFLPIILYL